MTTRTLLERTKVPLHTWLLVAWRVTQTKNGFSALSVQRTTGLSWQASWVLLHKLRVAMDQDGRDRLRGDVEIDETYVGGKAAGERGRSRGKKQPVAVACESRGSRMGRIRLARLPDASALALADFIEQNIEPGAILLSDSWSSYRPALEELGRRGLSYGHKSTNLSQTTRAAHEIHPHVHRVAALLKRWLLDTHQGSVEDPHLDAYLDEFVFRFNRRNARSRGLLFYRLCQSLVATGPLRVAELQRRRSDLEAADDVHARRVKAQKAAKTRARRGGRPSRGKVPTRVPMPRDKRGMERKEGGSPNGEPF